MTDEKKTLEKSIEEAAWHEAGHAVAALRWWDGQIERVLLADGGAGAPREDGGTLFMAGALSVNGAPNPGVRLFVERGGEFRMRTDTEIRDAIASKATMHELRVLLAGYAAEFLHAARKR